MKKILLSILCAACSTMMFAQSSFTTCPSIDGQGNNIMFEGAAMAENLNYVAGKESLNSIPAIWNTQTNTVTYVYQTVTTSEGQMPMTGAYYSVNNAGTAVGSITDPTDGISYPIMSTGDGSTYTTLYHTDADAGGAAWGISADGSIIVGFYFDQAWQTSGCIWTNNGQTRTDLAAPTAQEMGLEFDYVAPRWISDDGNTILGYAQSSETGSWVALAWKKVNGAYQPQCFTNGYWQSMWEEVEAGSNVYFEMEPTALSKDGNWVALRVEEPFDIDDWDIIPQDLTARFNLTTNTLEVLTSSMDFTEMRAGGISNNGICAGRINDDAQNTKGYVWGTGATQLSLLEEIFEGDAFLSDKALTEITNINGDGTRIIGYAITFDGEMVSFMANLEGGNVGIDEVEGGNAQPRFKGTYDLMGRKVDQIREHGIYIIDGKKVIR